MAGAADEADTTVDATSVHTLQDLAEVLRRLRRRHARRRNDSELTVRELARRSGYAYSVISEYLSGKVLAPTDRFDVLIRLLGASAAEQRALATARDRVAEQRRARHRSPAAGTVPRELPPDVYGFIGRERELAQLDRMAGAGIVAITGTAGVGKTALAVRWAYRARFPDGCLYADLRGYDRQQPVRPEHALAWFLRSLGVGGADIPHDRAERAARYRTMLADRRMLVVLDNVRDTEHVHPLLPGGSGNAVLVTSRDSLTGLVVRHGARRISLDPLPEAEAIELLRLLIGARVTDEPGVAASLARRCVRLPLILRLVAELASTRPGSSLADLDAELADVTHRLDRLDGDGEPTIASRAVFSWSYRNLDQAAAQAFRLMGLHPGTHLDDYALAALAGVGLGPARAALRALSRAHLVQAAGRRRYGMHDLLRAYAAELVAQDPEQDRRAALDRLREQQLYGTSVAMDVLAPFDRNRRPRVADPGLPLPKLADQAAATAWLDQERANLIAAALLADDGGRHASRLARIIVRYLDIGAHHQEAEQLYTRAIEAQDPAAQAHAMISLGIVCWRLGRYQEAVFHHERGLELATTAGDKPGTGRALIGLGILHWQLGRPQESIRCSEQALRLYRELNDPVGQAKVLGNLGKLHTKLGDYAAAVDYHHQALRLFRTAGDDTGTANELCALGAALELCGHLVPALEHLREALAVGRRIGYRETEATALGHLGTVCRRLGRLDEAVEHHERAVELFGEIGDRSGEGYALGYLGADHTRLGQLTTAIEHHQRGLRIAAEIGDDHLAAELLNHLGDAQLAAQRPRRALRSFQQALRKARRTGSRYEQARAERGAARALAATGDAGRAGRRTERALALFTDLGLPEADEVRAELARLSAPAVLPLGGRQGAGTLAADGPVAAGVERPGQAEAP